MIEVPDWIAGASSRSDAVPPSARTVMLGGLPTVLEGAADDSYFQAIEGQAAALDGLAALIQRQVPRNATVIDVGANIGLSTILLARMTQRVIAFEPSSLHRPTSRSCAVTWSGMASPTLTFGRLPRPASQARCGFTSHSSGLGRMSWRPAMYRAELS